MPSRVMPSIEAPAQVALTGANGFLAHHTIALLLTHGFRVVGTVRSIEKADLVRKVHNNHPKLDLVVLDDILSASKIVSALQPFHPVVILHLAAPFRHHVEDFERDFMIPAVHGSRAVLEAAALLPTVQRVVYTASFACVYDPSAGPCLGKTYTSEDWSPLTWEDGTEAINGPSAYRASKAVSERLSWEFMKKNKSVNFDFVSLCPAMVFGPWLPGAEPRAVEEINTSNQLIWSTVSAGYNSPVPPTRAPVWVDVRDVALAHLKSITTPEAGGGRYLLGKGTYCNQEIADISRRLVPKYQNRIPLGEPGYRAARGHFKVDGSPAEQVLQINYRTLDESLTDLLPQLYNIEETQGAV